MHKFFSLKIGWALTIFAFIDIACVGAEKGIPILCVLFGLSVGWYITRRSANRRFNTRRMLGKILLGAAITTVFTFVGMTLFLGPLSATPLDPAVDLANLDAPLILYEPVASFIGWLVLMIAILPFLQLLMTLFGSNLTLLCFGKGVGEETFQARLNRQAATWSKRTVRKVG